MSAAPSACAYSQTGATAPAQETEENNEQENGLCSLHRTQD